MWRFWILVCLFVVVECRRIHDPEKDKVKNIKETDISSGDKKDHKIVEAFDLDNCTDCKRDKQKFPETGALTSPNNDGIGKPKKDRPPYQKTGKDANTSSSKRGRRRKKAHRKSRNRKYEKNTKHHKGQKSKQLVSDPTDNSSQDRWRNPRLKQLPEVLRLEQRLHPTVKNPIHNMMVSMDRILQKMRYSVRKVDHDYHYMFNATRYDIMMNVREELMNIAKENDKAYDAVLQASLITKDIYRRAHRHHLLGPQTIPAAVSSDTMPKLPRIPLREHYMRAHEELQRAERLKHNIALAERERYGLQTRLMQIQRQVEEKLPARALTDLIRISNQTLRVLQTATLRVVDEDGRVHLYGHMHRNSLDNLKEARDKTITAKHILSQAKSQIANGRNLKNQIRRRVAERSPDTVADMPFDETRMMLWAVVDSARLHAEKLFKTAADIHMKLSPILRKAKDALANKDKGSLGRYLEEKSRDLREKMKALDRTLDMIRVGIGNEDILRDRCEEIVKNPYSWLGAVDQTIIDCDAYIIVEGSGIDIEGSGDISGTELDVEIPKSGTPAKREKDAYNFTAIKANEFTSNKGKLTEEGISFSKGNITKAGVTRLTDDEDMVATKVVPETTTVPTMTSTTPLSENVPEEVSEEDDDFTFTDWFGLLSDEPVPGHGHFNDDVNALSLNNLILEKLAIYSKDSRNVFGDTDKTMENLEDLQMRWNETKLTFESFENNVLSTKVFLHGWAAKKLYFDAVHDRVISGKDSIDLQSGLVEQQCSAATEVADKKLEAAEERREKHSGSADTAADPEDVRMAKESVAHVKDEVQKILHLKEVHPDPCKSIQNIDTALRTNVSELRKKIEKAKLIASTLQVPLSLKGSGYLTLPLDRDDETKSSSMSVEMNVKTESSDGPIAIVKSSETGSVVVSVKDNSPVLTVFDEDEYNIGELTSDMQLHKDITYKIFAERLGSLFSLLVYSSANKSLSTNDSILIASVEPYQLQPSTVYVAGAPEDFPTFGGESWQGCLSQLSVNGRFLSLLHKDSEGTMPDGCADMRSVQLEGNLVLGGSGYARLAAEPFSNINRDSMDNMMIQFKAYSDGVLVHIDSTSRRAFETIQIKMGRIVVSFKNYYGQTTLISKQDLFRFGVDYDLQVKVKSERQPNIDVLINGDSDAFETKQQSSEIQVIKENALFIGGLPKLQNSSISGCIRKFMINEQMLTLATVEKSYDVYYGVCEQGNCISFAEKSLPVDLGEAKGRNSLILSFTYRSKGTILEYSKGEKFCITLTLDDEGLDIYESVGEVSERIYLEDYAEGDAVTVNIEASSDEVDIRVGGVTKTVSYDGGGGWGNLFANDADAKYTVLVGGSTENDNSFNGNLLDFFMNGRPFDRETFLETNKLVRCVPPRKKRKLEELEVQESADVQIFTCE